MSWRGIRSPQTLQGRPRAFGRFGARADLVGGVRVGLTGIGGTKLVLPDLAECLITRELEQRLCEYIASVASVRMDIADASSVGALDLLSGGAARYAEQAPAVGARHDQLRSSKHKEVTHGYRLHLTLVNTSG